MTEASNVVPFPPQFRRVPMTSFAEVPVVDPQPAVDHDGRLYPLEILLRGLTPTELRAVEAIAPRSGQEAWDEVVRNWPALAAEIAASVTDIR